MNDADGNDNDVDAAELVAESVHRLRLPAGYHSVNPYYRVEGADRFIQFSSETPWA